MDQGSGTGGNVIRSSLFQVYSEGGAGRTCWRVKCGVGEEEG